MESTYERAVYKSIDVTGKTFGSYQVLGKVGVKIYPSGNAHHIWRVLCLRCNLEKDAQAQHVVNSKYGCKDCKGNAMSGIESCHWKGGTSVPGFFVSKAKHAAIRKSRTIEWNLSIQELDDLWTLQSGKCAYTGWELNFGKSGVKQTASLDRIDSSLGYVAGNVQFVHKDVNIMKWGLSDKRFKEICHAVARKEENK